jgi:hypothetical protein
LGKGMKFQAMEAREQDSHHAKFGFCDAFVMYTIAFA